MKIRTYKGRNLQKVYDTIHRELGPNAIIVKAQTSKGVAGLFKGQSHELTAVVDDNDWDAHVLSNDSGKEIIQKLSELQEKQIEDIGASLKEIIAGQQQEGRSGGTARQGRDIPSFAEDWDAGFIEMVGREVPDAFEEGAITSVADFITANDSFVPNRGTNGPQVIVLAGPTGSGKTTTLAKLAAAWSLDRKLKVGLITTDTFRVAAVDQAKEYAALMGLELRVVFSANEAAGAIQYFSDHDIVLVDTPGTNSYDQASMIRMKGIIERMGPRTTMLLVPATLDRNGAADLIENYGLLDPAGIIVTKVDEVRRYGIFSTVACMTSSPVLFITDGQRVPQDIHHASADEISNMLLGSTGDS